MQRFTYTVLARGTGLALRDALVTVLVGGTTELAELYSENSTSSEARLNPLTSDAFGEIWAYLPNGRYDLRVDYAGQPTRIIRDVQVFDFAEFDLQVGPLARLTGTGNLLPYFAGPDIAALTELTLQGREILAISELAELREYLGIADALALPLAIDQGGTGAGTAAGARTALGVLSAVEVDAAIDAAIAALPASPTPFYFVPFGFTTSLADAEVALLHVFPVAVEFPPNLVGSRGSVGTNPAAVTVLELRKNGATAGTISISTAGVVTFDTDDLALTFAAGDVLSVVGPATADTAIANCAFTLNGQRS